MGPPTPAAVRIDLIRILELLQEHITGPLCEAVFGEVRETERQRAWMLEALVQFWTAVILRPPRALSQALYETLEGRDPLFPLVQATPEAFFQRCQILRPAFFAEVFGRFTARLVPAVPARYAADLAPVQARFTNLLVLDGSRIAAIAHRLKLLWDERAVVLPGCLLALYDLGRGLCRALSLSPDAAAAELARAQPVLTSLARDTLLVADRFSCTVAFFAALGTQGCWGLTRRNRRLGLTKVRRLRKPALHERRFASVALEAIRVEPHMGPRRRRRFCAARRHWKSIAHVRGGRKMLKLAQQLCGLVVVFSFSGWLCLSVWVVMKSSLTVNPWPDC